MEKEDFLEILKAIVGILILGTIAIACSAVLFTVLIKSFEVAFKLI